MSQKKKKNRQMWLYHLKHIWIIFNGVQVWSGLKLIWKGCCDMSISVRIMLRSSIDFIRSRRALMLIEKDSVRNCACTVGKHLLRPQQQLSDSCRDPAADLLKPEDFQMCFMRPQILMLHVALSLVLHTNSQESYISRNFSNSLL